MENDTFITYEPVGMPRLEVRILRDTIWMTMQQMAMVFDVDRSVIGKHIRNVYKTGELVKGSTWAKIAQVRCEGKRQVTRFAPHGEPPSWRRKTANITQTSSQNFQTPHFPLET